MFAAALNTRSEGAEVAGMAKMQLANFQMLGYLSE
jgi:hypothetical protein